MPQPNLLTADLCDDHRDARVCEMDFRNFCKRVHFHGQVVTFETYEDNKGILDVIREGGEGKVLVVDGRGSRRHALCGGNIAAEAQEQGWEGMIFHGSIRDQHEFAELDKMGCKAIATCPMPPRRNGVARRGVDLNFGNIVIREGEWIYADPDGVIVAAEKLHA